MNDSRQCSEPCSLLHGSPQGLSFIMPARNRRPIGVPEALAEQHCWRATATARRAGSLFRHLDGLGPMTVASAVSHHVGACSPSSAASMRSIASPSPHKLIIIFLTLSRPSRWSPRRKYRYFIALVS